MIFLHPRFKISAQNSTSLALREARMIQEGAEPVKVFVSSGTQFNFNCVPVRGIMWFE